MSLALAGLWLCVGCEEDKAAADVVPIFKSEAQAVDAAPALSPESPLPAAAENSVLPDSIGAISLQSTNAATNLPPAKLVQSAVLPENLKPSPALSEIIKLAQAGVSEEVILAYVTNSARLFGLSADQIVYLNDLGVSTPVITALLHHDNTLDADAGKKSPITPGAVPPAPALTTPATNTPPPSLPPQTPVNPPAAEPPPPSPPGQAVAAPEGDGSATQPANVSYFYNSLAPYGNWVQVEGYGLCWQPTVAVVNSSWRPYADNGRWLWTDNGWYWYSDYSWGWAPFHYGRWCSYPRMGWIWVPDTFWGPSWVSWRSTPSHCGWAPLPPEALFVAGLGLTFHNSRVSLGFDFGFAPSYYNFVPLNRFCDRSPHRYFAPHAHAATIYQESTVINNYVIRNRHTIVNEGVGRDRVARATPGEIRKVRIHETPLAATPGTRPERLETDGSSMVVVRPNLPRSPLASPAFGQRRPGSEARTGFPVSSGAAIAQRPSAAPLASPAPQPNNPGSANAPRDPLQTKPARVGRVLPGTQTENSAEPRFRHSAPQNARSGRADRVSKLVPQTPNSPLSDSGSASTSNPNLASPQAAIPSRAEETALRMPKYSPATVPARNEQDPSVRHRDRFWRATPQVGSRPLAQEQNSAPNTGGAASVAVPTPRQSPTVVSRPDLNQPHASPRVDRQFAPVAPGVERALRPYSNAGSPPVRREPQFTQAPPLRSPAVPSFRPAAPAQQISRPSPQATAPVTVPSQRPQFSPPANTIAQPRHAQVPLAQPPQTAAPMVRPQPASPPPAAAPRFARPPSVAPQVASPPPATQPSPGNKRRDQQ